MNGRPHGRADAWRSESRRSRSRPFVVASPVSAAFPGENGRIAFASDQTGDYEIYTINPEGDGLT